MGDIEESVRAMKTLTPEVTIREVVNDSGSSSSFETRTPDMYNPVDGGRGQLFDPERYYYPHQDLNGGAVQGDNRGGGGGADHSQESGKVNPDNSATRGVADHATHPDETAHRRRQNGKVPHGDPSRGRKDSGRLSKDNTQTESTDNLERQREREAVIPEPSDNAGEGTGRNTDDSYSSTHGRTAGKPRAGSARLASLSRRPAAESHRKSVEVVDASQVETGEQSIQALGSSRSPAPPEQGPKENYGSPTRPRPPREHFNKPSAKRIALLDRHVLNTPPGLSACPVFEVVRYLLGPTQSPIEAAYVLFRWVTCLSVRQSATPRPGEDDSEQLPAEVSIPTLATYIRRLKECSIDHADLFAVLCKSANLETHKLEGKVRHYSSQPSTQLIRTRPATWSALLLPEGWGLVDCSLGSRLWHGSRLSSQDLGHHDSKAAPGEALRKETSLTADRTKDGTVHEESKVLDSGPRSKLEAEGRTDEDRRRGEESAKEPSSSSGFKGGSASGEEKEEAAGFDRRTGKRRESVSGKDEHDVLDSVHRAGTGGHSSDEIGDSIGTRPGDRIAGSSGHKHSAAVAAKSSSQSSHSFRHDEHCAPWNFFFLPPPVFLVDSHLPDTPSWQLLPHPLSETDFLTSLLLKPYFRYLDLDLVYPTALKVTNIAEEVDIIWKLKGHALRRFAFRMFSIGDERASKEDLTRYGFLENQHLKGEATLRLIPPSSGRYVCELYGTYLPSRDNEMTHLCSFDLDFVKTIPTPLQFPRNERVEWGPGGECLALGLKPVTHPTGCVNVDKGETQVIFASSRPTLVTQKLLAVTESDEAGIGSEVQRSTVNFRDPKNNVKILLRIPEAGDYVLSVFAKWESSPGKCRLVCNYLVLCDSGTPSVIRPFPLLPFNKIGPTKAFSDFQAMLICPKKSCVVVAPFSGKVAFVLTSPPTAELSCDLRHVEKGGEEGTDVRDYVQHTTQAGESAFRARLPLSGDYVFRLFAKPLDGEGHKFLLYTALVECAVPNKDCMPLAKVLPDWRANVHVLAPLRRFVVLGTVTNFAVRAYNAKAVTIVSRSGKQDFVPEDEDEDENEDEEEENENRKGKNLQDDKMARGHDEAGSYSERRSNFAETEVSSEMKDSHKLRSQTNPSTKAKAREAATNEDLEETGEVLSGSDHFDSGTEILDERKMKVTQRDDEEEEQEDEEEEDGWRVWRCRVKVRREDEGSGLKLFVTTSAMSDSAMICVAEFEVITERNMASKLSHQQGVWAFAQETFRVRPDSGHRSHLDDEERQSAYFLDDDLYVSNPLGDEDDDSSLSEGDAYDDVFHDDDDDYEEEDFIFSDEVEVGSDSDVDETTTVSSGSRSVRRGAGDKGKGRGARVGFVAGQAKTGKSNLRSGPSQIPPRSRDSRGKASGGTTSNRKKEANAVGKDREEERRRRAYHPTTVYSRPSTIVPGKSTSRKQASAPQNGIAQRQPKGVSGKAQDRTTTASHGKQQGRNDSSERQKLEGSCTRDEGRHNGKENTGDNNRHKYDKARQLAGSKERALRRKLWTACQRKDREAIQKAVTRYNRGGYPPCIDLTEAERLLHLFQLRDELVSALNQKDMAAIRSSLAEVERQGYAGEMSLVCRKAHAVLSPHRVQSKLPVLVEADMRTLLEIRSYRCPPKVVHHVVSATLLLMGVHEGLSKRWTQCQRRLQVLGPRGIHVKMVKVKVDKIHPEIAARAHELLETHTQDEANNAGPGVLAIFKWAQSIIARVESLAELESTYDDLEDDDPPRTQPASKRRQKEIFREQKDQLGTAPMSTGNNTDNEKVQGEGRPTKTSKGAAPGHSPREKKHVDAVSTDRSCKDRQPMLGQRRSLQTRKVSESPRVTCRSLAGRSEKAVVQPQDGKEGFKSGGRQNQGEGTHRGKARGKSRDVDASAPTSVAGGEYALVSRADNADTRSGLQNAQEAQYATRTTANHGLGSRSKDPGSKDTPRETTRGRGGNALKEITEQTSRAPGRNSQRQNSRYSAPATGNRWGPAELPRARASSGSVQNSDGKSGTDVARSLGGRGGGAADSSRRLPGRRYVEEALEPLRVLSPHKSPLFRPASKTKQQVGSVKPTHPVRASRPKTTPYPILQSTFFFASLRKKDEDYDHDDRGDNLGMDEDNNNNDENKGKVLSGNKTLEGRDRSLVENHLRSHEDAKVKMKSSQDVANGGVKVKESKDTR